MQRAFKPGRFEPVRGAGGHLSRGQYHSRGAATEPHPTRHQHALKRLRDLLQDPLFVRQGAHMMPTPFTRNMIEQVRQALQILEANLSQSHNFVPEHARRSFHLSLWEYLEALILPPLLNRLAQAAPGMSITTSRVKRRTRDRTGQWFRRSGHRNPDDDKRSHSAQMAFE